MPSQNKLLRLSVSNDLKSLTKISCFLKDNMNSMGIGEEKISEVQIAVDEAFTNIVQHSSAIDLSKKIEITCNRSMEKVEVRIKNYGKPFDPITAEIDPDLDSDINSREIGGLGIHFIRNFLDDLKYEYFELGGYEVLTMVKAV